MFLNKKVNPILKILFCLFIVFLALFIANLSGYYESKIRDNVVLTEDGIKEFESKIEAGEEIDLSSFLSSERTDYSNFASDLGDNVTSTIETIFTDFYDSVGNVLKSLF